MKGRRIGYLLSWCFEPSLPLGVTSGPGKKKKTSQTEEEVRRQHQGMDRPRVRKVPEGSGEQRKIEETGCEVIRGAPATTSVKGQMKVKIILCG